MAASMKKTAAAPVLPARRAIRTMAGAPPALRPLALSLLCLGLAPALAQTLPSGFNPLNGSASMLSSGNPAVMTIQQNTARGIVRWNEFSIGQGGTVNFNQPAGAVLLNRVVGSGGAAPLVSRIDGNLNATGHIFLVNPSGVLFGATSRVNVGGLVASTLDIADDQFMPAGSENRGLTAGDRFVFRRDDGITGEVAVAKGASIIAAPGGLVALLGATVRNEGEINVARGSAGLASGRVVTLDYEGDGLTNFTVSVDQAERASTAAVVNSGSVAADGGRIAVLAVSDAKGLVVNQQGVLRARSLSERNGEIRLEAGGSGEAEVRVAGTLDATGTAAGRQGGTIGIRADVVRTQAGAIVDASGAAGGGRITLAGDTVGIGADSSLKADALQAGNGGKVTVADGGDTSKLAFDGAISARGAGSGKGGEVRTEAFRVTVGENASVSAGGGATGANGSWRLGSGVDLLVQATGQQVALDDTSTVGAGTLGRTLGQGTDVALGSRAAQLDGQGGYGVAFGQDAAIVKTEGGPSTLSVDSTRSIRMFEGSAIQSKAGALNVDFNADADTASPERRGAIVLQDARIASNGGTIRFYGQGDPVNGRAASDLLPQAEEDLQYSAGIELHGSTVSTCGVAVDSCGGGGSILLRGQGSTRVTQDGALSFLDSNRGISVSDSRLLTGAGSMTLDGSAGIGSDGVHVVDSTLRSSGGDIALVGRSRGWASGDGFGLGMDSGNGVAISSSAIATGGSVRIQGTGGDISAVTKNAAFMAQSASVADDVEFDTTSASGAGVLLDSSSISAGKGRAIEVTGSAGSQGFTVTNAGGVPTLVLDPDGAPAVGSSGVQMQVEGGRLAIDGGSGNVRIDACCGNEPALLSTASATGAGGSIDIRGRNVVLDGYVENDEPLRVDSSGAGQAGSIAIHAVGAPGVADSGIAGVNYNVTLAANAIGAGNGGRITVVGDNTLRAYGRIEAKGGAAGGDGGSVETSGGAFDISGIAIDASAGPGGKNGSWLIDPYNVDIVNGAAAGSLTGNPFVPLAASVIQDGDINAALLSTDVTITTGVGGLATDGDIVFDDAQIFYSGAADRTFRLDANRSIRANGPTTISAFGPGAGALNVVFNADANGGGLATGGGQVSYSGQIYTNGGNVVMNGAWANPTNGGCSICLDGPVIDTRRGNQLLAGPDIFTGGSDLAAGGNVQLTGRTIGPGTAATVTSAVLINGTRISSSTGNVGVFGSSPYTSGIVLESVGPASGGGIFTTSGNIALTGIGSFTPNSNTQPGHGVVIGGTPFATTGAPTLQTGSGNIDISGVRLAGGGAAGNGVLLANRSLVTTTGGGNITVTGESQGNGAGVLIQPQLTGTFGTIASGRIAGSGNVVLRAANDGTTDALSVGATGTAAATVSAASVLDLRPGGLNVAGTPDTYTATAVDRTANPILFGGAAATGFAVSAVELTRMSAPTIVAGSNAHAADISVVGPISMASALTLQNGGGGNIALGAPVTTPQLGLVSAGNITQAAGADIAAGTLLARSTGGSVLLANPGNNVGTVGGDAAGRFEYVDANALTLGPVSVTGFDAAANLPQVVSASSMAAGTVLVRTLSEDLSLGGNVSSTGGADLVAAARFQNLGTNTVSGAPWRVWADTWVGETRGGLAGSGTLPNLYHCAYLGLCTVAVPPADNHFIYAQQPLATVVIGNATRPFGLPNPLFFTYSVTGLILGDTLGAFAGSTSTTATSASLPGSYPISGSFSSPAGYAFNVLPGTLLVTAALDLPKPDVLRDIPTTYLYDRNIGQAPICLATGPLEGDRAQQGADVLAREWSRVRSRPNLLNCVDTERRNGCGDF